MRVGMSTVLDLFGECDGQGLLKEFKANGRATEIKYS